MFTCENRKWLSPGLEEKWSHRVKKSCEGRRAREGAESRVFLTIDCCSHMAGPTQGYEDVFLKVELLKEKDNSPFLCNNRVDSCG